MYSPEVQETLKELHRSWDELHSRLRRREQDLSEAIAGYARGQRERPESLMKEVEQMRADCSVRFKQLMDAVRREGHSGK